MPHKSIYKFIAFFLYNHYHLLIRSRIKTSPIIPLAKPIESTTINRRVFYSRRVLRYCWVIINQGHYKTEWPLVVFIREVIQFSVHPPSRGPYVDSMNFSIPLLLCNYFMYRRCMRLHIFCPEGLLLANGCVCIIYPLCKL